MLRPMKGSAVLLAALALLVAAASTPLAAAESAAAEKSSAGQKHPLRGVVTGVLADRSSVLVKHEAIPGVMRAMTMAFKVDAPTLARLKEGDAISGLMSRQGNAWVLEDVKPAADRKP